ARTPTPHPPTHAAARRPAANAPRRLRAKRPLHGGPRSRPPTCRSSVAVSSLLLASCHRLRLRRSTGLRTHSRSSPTPLRACCPHGSRTRSFGASYVNRSRAAPCTLPRGARSEVAPVARDERAACDRAVREDRERAVSDATGRFLR